ncbi:uncharacterized protein LOC143367374 [Andrena cerasifolii]|uniref:uncharacterized protein LOC143367374 n=1 Tax=Andrena cerasifolii TaxID=2819439 RepID=UPI0040384D50
MMMEELSCDIAHVLQNRDFSVLQKLVSYCYSIRAKIAAKVADAATYEIECSENRTLSVNKISELQQTIESLKSEIDATKLQQKIVDKKISNAIKREEELREEINNTKLKRDDLSIEMVDLQQEYERKKEQKLLTWNAIKRACHTYKQYLDTHVHVIEDKECDHIKISFFIHDNVAPDKYFVYLFKSNNQWKVEKIQPALEAEHLNDFKGIVDFYKQSEISDVTLFLCRLRHIFLKYYLNGK